MTILDGKKVSNDIKDEITLEVLQLKKEGKKTPHFAAIIVGNDGASRTYVGAKVKACNRVGFLSTLIELSQEISEASLLSKIEELNNNNAIDGLMYIRVADIPESTVKPVMEEFQAELESRLENENNGVIYHSIGVNGAKASDYNKFPILYEQLPVLNPDLIITAAYGQIVPQEVLDAPKIMAVNIHGSLLPKYRGGAPIHYSVINGDEKTGVTIMEMIDKKLG